MPFTASEKVLQKMAQAVEAHNQSNSNIDEKFNRYKNVTCHIQESLDTIKWVDFITFVTTIVLELYSLNINREAKTVYRFFRKIIRS